ncbi:MAG: O-antigen ligase family protein [Gammaproteobacteria bacterium]|nr:O-antigen ligase family protein [Gammaproteobacteria bacterium]
MSILIHPTTSLEVPKTATLSRVVILFGLMALMLCVPLLNKCFWAAILLILASNSWYKDWKVLLQKEVFVVALVLILLFTLGITYSHASWNYAFRSWDKYLKIFYLLFFLPLFIQKKARTQAIYCLIISVMVSEIFTYLHFFNLLDLGFPTSKHWLFVQDIDAGFVVSFTAFVLVNLAVDNKRWRAIFLICFLICSIDVLILNQERTGYLIYLALAALFFLQRFRWKGVLAAIILLPLFFASLYISSDQFNNRTNQVVSNILDYQKGNQNTSIGLRLSFAQYSFSVIKHHLLIGSGTGSFEEIYRTLNGPKINNETWPAHPHNEYISILFQLGVVGLSIFLYWIYLQIRFSFSLPQEEKFLMQGLVLAFVLLGFCNASLLVNPAGACYVSFLAIFMAAKYEGKGIKCE